MARFGGILVRAVTTVAIGLDWFRFVDITKELTRTLLTGTFACCSNLLISSTVTHLTTCSLITCTTVWFTCWPFIVFETYSTSTWIACYIIAMGWFCGCLARKFCFIVLILRCTRSAGFVTKGTGTTKSTTVFRTVTTTCWNQFFIVRGVSVPFCALWWWHTTNWAITCITLTRFTLVNL